MTSSSNGLTAPFALARFRQGADVRLGLVAGERIRPLDAAALGASDLNAFLAAPDWDRLGALASDDDGEWMPLAEVTLTEIVQQPLIDPDQDDVSRLILDSLDQTAFAAYQSWTVGRLREWLLAVMEEAKNNPADVTVAA